MTQPVRQNSTTRSILWLAAFSAAALTAAEAQQQPVAVRDDPLPLFAALMPVRLVYRITVACPSPAWPATADAPAIPSRPAELGYNEQKSYDQPATGGVE